MEWKPVTWPIKKMFKTQPSAGKVMLRLLIDSHVPTLEHCQDRDTTVNRVNYSAMLWDWLRPGFQTKYQGMVTVDAALLHDSMRLHTCHLHSRHPLVFELWGVGASFL
jgi:hypothetical protein